jgi:hypothetical protein
MRIASTIWQLPQTLVGLALWGQARLRGDDVGVVRVGNVRIITLSRGYFAVSLGQIVVFGGDYPVTSETIAHELGHCVQSRLLGPLYLPTVGFWSMSRNIYDRRRHRHWDRSQRLAWYYRSWPENAADRRGGVIRQSDLTRSQ